ncbi:hypothetical protein [Sphingobium sp.]|uniref:hypothetical protein n=1 Tax=Sphingobium sp. TaxID=1912891 RepID=UPI003B3B40C8
MGHASDADLRALPAFSGDAGALLQSLQLLMMQGIAHPVRHGPVAQEWRIDALAQRFTRNGVGIAIIAPCAIATLGSGRV